MISNKIIGYILLALGVAVICFATYQSYNIFTGKAVAPEIFTAQKQTVVSQKTSQLDLQAQLQNIIGQQILSAINPGDFPKMMNLTSWSILALILVFGGSAIATLGIKMVI